MENGLTASDVALMQRDTNVGWGDGSFMWIFALLILLFGGNGFGFGNNGLAQGDLQRAVDLNSIQNGQRDIEARVQEIGAELTSTIKDSSYNNLSEIRDMQQVVNNGFANMQKCCCETQRAIDGVNYNILNQSSAIQANATANTQKILDAISTNRMADMQNQINQLQLQNAMFGVVKYPYQTAYCSGANPFACTGSTTTTTS